MNARVWAPLVAAGLAACASPEAARVRGGGPGSDTGNKGAIVEIHAGTQIYYKTPCRTAKVKCSGPVPDTGT
jgi:hypothetical protein